jgi:hypothetical protein
MLRAISPIVSNSTYKNERSFYAALDTTIAKANVKPGDTLVFPEHIGTWLVAADEWRIVYALHHMQIAMFFIIMRHFVTFIYTILTTQRAIKDKLTYALLSIKNAQMLQIYVQTFTKLAKKYKVVIVAGSIAVKEDNKIYNRGYVFDTNGDIIHTVNKVFLTKEEQLYLQAGSPEQLLTFDFNNQKHGVLVCADSWYPPMYTRLVKEKVDNIMVPACVPQKAWSTTWLGYSGHKSPDDVESTDIGTITEERAWQKYSFYTRARKPYVASFLQGKLWGSIYGQI